MTSSLESTAEPRDPEEYFGAEHMSALALVEGWLKGRRVLEIGVEDPRSLLRFLAAGAVRVVGTTQKLDSIPGTLRDRPIELFGRAPGEVAFGEADFDAVFVKDLASELRANRDFLLEVRRMLAPEGFALLSFPSHGQPIAALVARPRAPLVDPERLREEVRHVFPEARFLTRTPFVGVILGPEASKDEGTLALDASLAGPAPAPSHLLALCGARVPAIRERTLFELSFVDLEISKESWSASSSLELARARAAVKALRGEIGKKDAALRAFAERLPALRRSLEARLSRPPGAAASASERPRHEGESGAPSVAHADLEGERERELLWMAIRERDEATQREEAQAARVGEELRRLVSALEDAAARQRALRDERDEARLWISALEDQIGALRREVQAPSAPRAIEVEENGLGESLGRPESTPRPSATHRPEFEDPKLEDLRAALEHERRTREALEHDLRGSESRLVGLHQQIERLQAERVLSGRELSREIEMLRRALAETGGARDALAIRVQTLEREREREIDRGSAEETERRLRTTIERERSRAEDLSREADLLRLRAHEAATEIERASRALADRDAEVAMLRERLASSETDRSVVELAAGHLSRELEGARERIRTLRQDRDALAATSALLIEERDALRRSSLDISSLLAEREGQKVARVAELEAALGNAEERNRRLLAELSEVSDQLRSAESRKENDRTLAIDLEREIQATRLDLESAELRAATHLRAKEALEQRADEGLRRLEEAVLEVNAWRDRARELEQRLLAADAAEGAALSALHRAEAQAIAARVARREADGMLVGLRADLVMREAEFTAREAEFRATEEEFRARDAEFRATEAEFRATEAELTVARSALAALRGEFTALRREVDASAAAEGSARSRAEAAELAIEGARQALAAEEKAHEETRTALGRTLEEAAGIDRRLREAEKALAAGSAEIGQLRRSLERSMMERHALRESVESLEVRLTAAMNRASELEDRWARALKESDLEPSAPISISATSVVPTVSQEWGLADDDRATLAVRIDSMQDLLNRRIAEIVRLRSENFELNEALERVQTHLAARVEALRDARQKQAFEEELGEAPSRVAGEVAMLRRQLDRVTSEHRDLVERHEQERALVLERARDAASRHALEMDEVRAQLGRAQAELRQLREQDAVQESRLARARSDSDALRVELGRRGEVETLKRQLESRDEEIARLSSEGQSLVDEAARLRRQKLSTEETQVALERRVAELSAALEESEVRLELVRGELAAKTERLRRISDLGFGS